MTTQADILEGVRQWHRTALGWTVAEARLRVIPADDKGTRPPLPYLTVKVLTQGIRVGRAERLEGVCDTLAVVAGGVEDDVYALTVDGVAVEHTRTEDDTDTTVLAALGALLVAAAPDATVIVRSSTVTVVGATLADADPLLTVENDLPYSKVRQQQRGTVSVQGFGRASSDWLDDAAIALDMHAVADVLDVHALTVEPLGGLRDLSALVADSIEGRYLREYEITYALATEAVAGVPLATVDMVVTYGRAEEAEDDVDALVDTYTITVDT
jgi:hypothetical protein